MKRFLSVFLICVLSLGIILLCACEPEQQFDYDSLYKSKPRETAYGDMIMASYNMAKYGYTKNTVQGYNGWYYMSGKDNVLPLRYTDSGWTGNNVVIKDEKITVKNGDSAVLRFVANKQEQSVIFGNARIVSGKSGAVFAVTHNGNVLWQKSLAVNDTDGLYFELPVSLNVGDKIDFTVTADNATVSCDPVIYYGDASGETLYHLTTFGKYYGDVFPWYDSENGRLYMGYIWTDDARKNDYKNALEYSDNMLTFTEIPEANNYDIWRKYKENGRLHYLYDVNKFIDRSIYTFGSRDNMVYKDIENNRLLIISGCYYRFDAGAQTSDLVIYATDDIYGLSRTKDGVVVAKDYNRNLPECPSLMKIGNRWYVFVSVAYNTAHQVGPLQYWTGDENVDCMDVDWLSKDFAFVDGEDLCAARPIKIGDKVYMWGWIPLTYDTMPWSPWGGYLNLPREVVQHADGSLGGRMDSGLAKVLNYGNIYTLDDGNFDLEYGKATFKDGLLDIQEKSRVLLSDNLSRNFVQFTVDMKNSQKCGYLMSQQGKDYEVCIVKENGKTYLVVSSPNDAKHKENSRIQIANDDVYNVKITIDNGIIEFFVNDSYALTAHTAMTNAPYTAYLYSDGSSQFKNVKINKLAPYCVL